GGGTAVVRGLAGGAGPAPRQPPDPDARWASTQHPLPSLAKARLYKPDITAPDLGEFDPTATAPTGLIRQAMRVAGGVRGSDNATQLNTSGEGDVWITTPDGSSPGGIATGETITQIIRNEGGSVQGYRWVYGPADRRSP